MSEAIIKVDGSLLPWKRVERGKHGRAYNAKDHLAQQRAIQLAWLAQVPPATRASWRMGDDYAVAITVTWPDARRKDIDNAAKQVLDALKGAAWDDDEQVVSLLVVRTTACAEEPFATVSVCSTTPLSWDGVLSWFLTSGPGQMMRALADAAFGKWRK